MGVGETGGDDPENGEGLKILVKRERLWTNS